MNQKRSCGIISSILLVSLICNFTRHSLGKGIFFFLIQWLELTFFVLGKDFVHLPILEGLDGINEQDRRERLLINLLDLFAFNNMRRFLKRNVEIIYKGFLVRSLKG